jgi:DNA-binding transcriptional MerR regulator
MLHQLDLFGGEPVKLEGKPQPAVSRGAKNAKEKKPASEIQETTNEVAEPATPFLNQPDLFSEIDSFTPVKPILDVEKQTTLQKESSPIQALSKPETIHQTDEFDHPLQSESASIKPIPAEAAGPAISKQKKSKQAPVQTEQVKPVTPEIPEDEILFSKQYYPISEVAGMFGVNVSLLRYWEKEFDIIKPRKNRKGDRLFRPADIKNLKLIHFLLKEKKYTIKGAKDFLKKGKSISEKFEAVAVLKGIRTMLVELKSALS